MDIRQQIDYYLNTAFKKKREDTAFRGHELVHLGQWNRTAGFVKYDSAKFEDTAFPSPVIAIVDERMREDNITLSITAKIAQEDSTETFEQIGREITLDTYEPTDTTVSVDFEIPRFTRKGAVFLISGLGNKVYEITNITANVDIVSQRGGKVNFYALASTGSKILWLIGMYKIHNMIKEIINSIWIAPDVCPYCDGSGVDPDTGDTCPQCDSYGYSGYNAEKGIQIDKGYDVRLTREKFDEYPVSDANNELIWKFINQVWTQKWWVTPTVNEIKRLFAHFYNVREEDIIITERYHFSMPHWQIDLPRIPTTGSPFDAGDIDLIKFIAESVTPAGVNVFVGFYDVTYIGNLDELLYDEVFAMKSEPKLLSKRLWEIGSLSYEYDDWGSRLRNYNGWIESVDNFEDDTVSGIWTTAGTVNIFNANDKFRHVARLAGSSASMTYDYGTPVTSGHVEFWCHPETSDLECSLLDSGDTERYWIRYEQSSKSFIDTNGSFWSMYPDNEAHLRIYHDNNTNEYKVFVNKIITASGAINNDIQKIQFHNTTNGTGFIDGFGWTAVSGYTKNKNFQTLYPWGWGINHTDCVSGVSGLYMNYFIHDRPFIGGSGVC